MKRSARPSRLPLRVAHRAPAPAMLLTLAVFLVLAALATITFPRRCAADDTNLGRAADGVFPLDDSSVTMVRETVVLKLRETVPGSQVFETAVSCEFLLRNDGAEKEILVGFPTALTTDAAAPDEAERHRLRVRDFRASVDGVEVEVSNETASKRAQGGLAIAEWATFRVRFTAGQTRRVTNTYRAANTMVSNGEVALQYILRTGRQWAGPIGSARVELDTGIVEPHHLIGVYPSTGWRIEDGKTWVWEARDFEPLHDLAIYFNLRAWSLSPDETLRREFEAAAAARGDTAALLAQYQAHAASLIRQEQPSEGEVTLLRYLAALLAPGLRPPTPAPVIRGMEAVQQEPGTWSLSTHVVDPDADLLAVAIEVVSGDGDRRTVHLRKEDRREEPHPWSQCWFSAAGELPRLPGLTMSVVAEDLAGNVTRSEGLAVGAAGGWRHWTEVRIACGLLLLALGAVVLARRRHGARAARAFRAAP